MADKLLLLDDVQSLVNANTIEGGKLAISLKAGAASKNFFEIRLTDLGLRKSAFSWDEMWGTRKGENGSTHDSVALRFNGKEARDAAVYGLWQSADQLFRLGHGSGVRELRLSIDKLPKLFKLLTPQFKAMVIYEENHAARSSCTPIESIPDICAELFQKHGADNKFVCIGVEIVFPTGKKVKNPALPPVALFAPSTLPHKEAVMEKMKNRTVTFEDFYFDANNEALLLEIATWQATEVIRRIYADDPSNRDSFELKTMHAFLRKLTVMHDISAHLQEHEMQNMADLYPGLDLWQK